MNLKFVISKSLLAASVLFSTRGKTLSEWTEVKNKLWDKYNDAYSLFNRTGINKFFTENYKDKLKIAVEEIDDLLLETIESDPGLDLIKETEEYKKWLEREWDEQKETISKELRDILRIDLPEKEYTVYIVAPKVGGGSYLGTNEIFWGHTEDWPNYNVIYLAHEFLHSILKNDQIGHALIELIADNELRIRLNNEKDYYQMGDKLIGHDYLLRSKEEILTQWKDYLRNKDVNIHNFYKKLKL